MLRTALVFALVACGNSAPPPAAPKPVAPTPPPVVKAPSSSGIWLGALQVGAKQLRLQVHLDLAAKPASCALDSLDQDAMGIPCDNVVATTTALSFDVPIVKGSFAGTVDGDTVKGTFTQGGQAMAITLARQAKALESTKPPTDAPMPPVDVEHIQAVIDKDLEKVLAREAALGSDFGVTIGVIEHGVRKVFSYGSAKPDSLFEIGSITKTFTGLTLAQMVQQKKLRLDQPIRELLPKGTLATPASGAEITLLDLTAQRSGLPRMPDNIKPADENNPYADYDKKLLYAYVSAHGVALPAKPEFGYSNLGVGLLGQLLADRAGTSYEALVQKEVLTPLGMKETAITLTPALQKRFMIGHDASAKPTRAWDFAALAGAGAIRSTANDMLTYLDAQLHPDHVKGTTPEAKTLSAAITASHAIQEEIGGGMHIALNWLRFDKTGSFWHNGGTGGFGSFAVFNADKDFGIIVLFDRTPGNDMFADELGEHVLRRLIGEPAESLLH